MNSVFNCCLSPCVDSTQEVVKFPTFLTQVSKPHWSNVEQWKMLVPTFLANVPYLGPCFDEDLVYEPFVPTFLHIVAKPHWANLDQWKLLVPTFLTEVPTPFWKSVSQWKNGPIADEEIPDEWKHFMPTFLTKILPKRPIVPKVESVRCCRCF